ncbi:MAG: diguanylate cyclase [Spirochaetales bacterium]|nr:diguanylate cyclase [Spirochaetales bacterium]
MTDSLKLKLEKLRTRYVSSLPGKIRKISILAKQIRTKKWTVKKRNSFINLIHRMAGSGETFGEKELSEAASKFERLCRETLTDNGPVSPLFENELQYFLKKMKEIAFRAGNKECRDPGEETKEQTFTPDPIEEKQVYFFLEKKIGSLREDQFKHYGYTLMKCSCISELLNNKPTAHQIILIFDIQTLQKEQDSLQRIAKLSQDEKGINIVVISDDDTLNKRLLAARGGADIFIAFPFDVPSLINKLNLISQNKGSDPYHILIVDDDVEYVAWCSYTLQQEGMITSVISKPETVFSQLIETRPELILMDWHMPEYSGFDLACVIRQQESFISIPIVFLTSESDPKKRMKAMRIGVDDFLLKPISSEYLVEAVKIRAERYRTLRFYMERDSLTGLYNHSKIIEFLSTELSRAKRHKTTLSFAMIDIDFFKLVNDTYGHLNGDKVLKDLANLFKERLRKDDLMGRYGGEEFAIIFPNTEAHAVVNVLDEIRKSFAHIIHQADKRSFSVTFSAGVVASTYCKDAQTIIQTSDIALYKAKSRGRNKIILLDSPL